MKKQDDREWWRPGAQGGFFGEEYLNGDDSEEGPYCDTPRSLGQRTEREVNSVVSLLQLTPGHRVLDCPCGCGRHSIGLACKGIRVIGIDLNPAYLQRAAHKMKEQGLADSLLELKEGDMRSIPVDSNSVDAVINMFTSFGFFETDEDNIQVLREFYRVLKPGGSLLIHLDYNPNIVRAGRWEYENHTRQLKDNAKLLVDERYDSETKRIVGSWMVVEDSDLPNYERHYSLRAFSPEEYRTILSDCGFKRIEVLGDFEEPFGELNEQSLETVIKATKR